jgi:ATP-dependent DNA helicase DinG
MHRDKISQLLGSYSRHLDHLGHSERLPDLVNWVQTDGKRVALLSTPLDVAPQIRDWLFAPGGPTTVFMSATLSLGGSDPFAYFRKQVGLEAGAALEQEFPSPFDYPKHCLLYLPKHLPMPNELAYNAAVAEEVKDLLAVSQGRAFVLFTATRAMVEVHQLVAEQVPWPCRHQEQSSKRALLDWFLTTPNAVLFGVNSFWEGVSVVGSQLSLVIIDRCPFQSPGDPVYDARCEQVRQQQGSWFEQLALPHAALRLKQGCGRLIRTSSDRGIIALLDPRLTRKGYGKVLRQSLPPGRVVHELDPALFQQYLVVP